jgi:hypothetical protein
MRMFAPNPDLLTSILTMLLRGMEIECNTENGCLFFLMVINVSSISITSGEKGLPPLIIRD